MRILIAYDGSHGADAALDDLPRAGLPADAEAMVLCVADASMALASRAFAMAETGATIAPSDHRLEKAAAAVKHARELAAHAVAQLRTRFPGWRVSPDASGGSAASSIVLRADLWKPDLLVVGSRGRARPARLLLGSVARKVGAEARCSVRVARAPTGEPGAPVRVLVCHDGGGGGRAALLAAAARAWPDGSRIHAVAVQRAEIYVEYVPEFGAETTWRAHEMPPHGGLLRKTLESDVERARRPGLSLTADVVAGAAADSLLRIMHTWNADCVFVGATRRGRADHVFMGNVSAAIADRARCSVEVVRAPTA